MSENLENGVKDTKKRRGYFWYIVICAIILFVVYQSGRSAGIRSMSETVERMAPASQTICRAVPQEVSTSAITPTLRPPAQNRSAASSPGESVSIPVPAIPVQRVVAPGPPPGLVPSVIAPADPGQVPYPAPIFSIYENRSPHGSARASELGLMPLQSLESLPAAPPAMPRTTFRQDIPQVTPPVPVRSPVPMLCDCGVVH